jgi:hypothetical protein
VYLNCCSTSLTVVLQTSQTNAPKISSGRTSLVLVTVPLMLMSVPILAVRSSRIPEVSGRLWNASENSRVRRPVVDEPGLCGVR